jgi:hypothetical protein
VAVMIEQNTTVLSLSDGIPQVVTYKNRNDPTKYFLYDLPKGNSTVVFNIRSKTKAFYPILYVSIHKNLQNNYLQFPPSELIDYYYFEQTDWDIDMFHFKQSMLLENMPD